VGANAEGLAMNIKGVTYSIDGCWKDDMEHPAEIGAQFVALLDRIESAIPVKTVWLLFDFAGVDLGAGPDAEPPVNTLLTDARKDMTAFVERNDIKDEDGSTDPRNGYRLLARGTEDGREFGSSQSIDVVAEIGSHWDNELKFEVGDLLSFPEPVLTTYPIYRGALEAMASTMPCPYVWARYCISWDTGDFPPGPVPGGPPIEIFDGAWIAYLSAPLAAGFTPPEDLFPERTPGGGLILSAVKDHIDPANPDHVRASQKLQTVLSKQVARPNHRGKMYPADFPPRVGPY
jgi:hypothetical protein